jgi:GT2 family glycosyltransferase
VRASDDTDSILAPAPRWRLPDGPAPTVSVVIPVYNGADSVAEAVQSALDQTQAAHEVIVVDDGSADHPERALARFGDRITLIRSEHRGAAGARNLAVARAGGEFVAMLDADDRYRPARLEAFMRMAVRRPDLDILATDAELEVDGEPVSLFSQHTPFAVIDQRHAILDRCFFVCPAIRRSALLAVGGYEESLRTGEDWELAIRLILSGSVAGLVAAPLYGYRLRPDSLTADRLESLRDRVRLLELTRGHPGLSAEDRDALERSIIAKRLRLRQAEAELALTDGDGDARRRALALAMASGAGLRQRVAALGWAVRPGQAARSLQSERDHSPRALASAAPWRLRS